VPEIGADYPVLVVAVAERGAPWWWEKSNLAWRCEAEGWPMAPKDARRE